jgi:hypothetical protein
MVLIQNWHIHNSSHGSAKRKSKDKITAQTSASRLRLSKMANGTLFGAGK